MAERGMFATTELGPLLAERGVVLSREQVYRLAAGTPERLSLHTLAALCDILDCTPSDLIEPVRQARSGAKNVVGAKLSPARRRFRAICGPSGRASSPTPRISGERWRRPIVWSVWTGAADQ
jgi:DNA-binding Xre family transcriptional regulator